ncbi:MAG: pyruvate formate lyase family protein [Candidatus Latescibacteria bacterium]|jgi:formate C-acetyltransferase|nr:pyruvate formate lyase family protein [Candidatus Latescibacterota bacterium]
MSASEMIQRVELPSGRGAVCTRLRPETAALREAVLGLDWDDRPGVAIWPIVDAATWSGREEGEDWLLWRGRRTAARLRAMPIELSPGERIVGRPEFRHPTPDEALEIEAREDVLKSIPPFPGGDSGHFHPDLEKLLRVGIGGLREEVDTGLANAGSGEREAFYRACGIVLDGLSDFCRRVADACETKADGNGRGDWRELGQICRTVSDKPPSTFHEAIQLMFLTIVALWFGEDHGLTTPGRMDRTLLRFYEADIAAGRLTSDEALELICGLYIQLNMVCRAGLAVSVLVGGRDQDGCDVTNDLTYLCLAARAATQLVYPTVGLTWHEDTPSELTDFSCRMIRTGIGDPAFFNDDLIAAGLRDHGVSEADAHDYMNSTCVEIKVVGASNMWVTAPYFNCPRALLDTIESIATGSADPPPTFRALKSRVQERLAAEVQESARELDAIWAKRGESGCFPLASCLTRDCLERGIDFDRGGARYNWVENSFVGLANLADGLVAVDHLVYETGELDFAELWEILSSNFSGQESLRQRIVNRLSSYGNDIEQVDRIAVEMAAFLSDTTESNTVGLHRYVPGFFCWIVHERFGRETGATPDGRRTGFPLADGAGAAQGRERSGPTASVLSTTKWDHQRALGGLVHNVRFSRDALRTDRDLRALRDLIETYLRRGGFEIQANVVDSDVLRDAQDHPEDYPDLLVRVAGYSDYFVNLNRNMQEEVIARTEHTTV